MSLSIYDSMLLAVAVLIALPMLLFCVECLLASLKGSEDSTRRDLNLPRFDVVIPAHDEASEIEATLVSVTAQLGAMDRVFVVADNCTDDTAEKALSFGAAVLVREDPERRGKGYALQFAIDHLRDNDAAPVVVFLDADCQVEQGALASLASVASSTGRPAQAAYIISCHSECSPQDRLSSFAILVKNVVRPLGMRRLGLPCLLTGSGMAFPWKVIVSVDLATGNIVEDMQLAVDLMLKKCGPKFDGSARVLSRLPNKPEAKRSQRTRWEHGHLATLVSQMPRLIVASLRQRRIDLPLIALDLCIPPLSFLTLLWLAATTCAAAFFFMGGVLAPMMVLVVSGGAMLLGTAVAWWRFGRRQLPLATLLAVPWYVARKLPSYLRFFVRRETAWIRTERDRIA
ncbi:MAG: glycosyltransferase family 2 protein [Pirellulales bacterium]|nr:glycosyltransferase family 2 protein [Pirellulales bacterium]